MKIKGLFLLIYVLIFYTSPAQIMFQRHYGGSGDDGGNSVIQTSDGGYLVAGLTDSWGAGSKDIYLIKTNEYGDTTWTKHYGGYNWDDAAAVIEGTDNNFYITGGVSSFGNGATDAFLMKVSSVGDSVWLKTYGGTEDDDGYDLLQCNDGGFMITGASCSFAIGFSSVYAIRTDANGDTLWTRTYEKEDFNGAYSVIQTTDNGFLFAGVTGTAGSSTYDCYVVRINSAGDTLWTKTYGGSSYDVMTCVCKLTDGNYLLSGATWSFGAGGYDMYLIKIDTNGGVIWEKTYGGTANDYGYKCIATTDNGAVITGKTASFGAGGDDVYLVNINLNGDSIWTRKYGGTGDDRTISIKNTSDGGFIACGYTSSFGANSDVYLIKTRSDGVAGIENVELSGIMVTLYPNPCTDLLNISFKTTVESEFLIELINLQGQIIHKTMERQNIDNLVSINVSSLVKGLYLLQISSNDKITTQEIVIN